MAELAKVLDILRPQNKERQATHTHHSCEDVSLHLYAYSISASSQRRFLSLLVETAGLQVVPIPHLFPHYVLYIVIFDILIIYILFITYFTIYIFSIATLLPGGVGSQYYPQIQEACEGDLANESPLNLLSGFLGKLYILDLEEEFTCPICINLYICTIV